MNDKVFGHDGRGKYYGTELIDVPSQKEIKFDDIATKGDVVSINHIEGTEFGKGFLNLQDKESTLEYLDIDPDTIGEPGPAGPRGPEGPMGPVGPAGLTWRGEYNDTTQYVKDDSVGYSGASYFCTKDSLGNAPLPDNEYWALLAAQGARGKPGLDGEPGKKGDDGKPGKDGKDAVFDIESLTQSELKELSQNLYKANKLKWVNKAYIGMPYNTANVAIIKIADTNLQLKFTPTGYQAVKIDLSRVNSALPALYDVKRSTQYDGGIEGATFANTEFTDSWINIDAVTYTNMRESDWLSIFERSSQTWWRCYINIAGSWQTNDTGVYILIETVKMQEF